MATTEVLAVGRISKERGGVRFQSTIQRTYNTEPGEYGYVQSTMTSWRVPNHHLPRNYRTERHDERRIRERDRERDREHITNIYGDLTKRIEGR